MNKETFLSALEAGLTALPPEEKSRSLAYYGEMIGDRVEDGMSEEDAVAALGSPEELARNVVLDTPLPSLLRARAREKRPHGRWWLPALIVGAPLWIPLGVAALAVLLAFYVVIWSLIAALFAVVLSLGLTAPCGLITLAVAALTGSPFAGLAAAGIGLIGGGIALLLLHPAILAARGLVRLTAAPLRRLKTLFLTKGETK